MTLRRTDLIHTDLTEKVIGRLFDVYNQLGSGYREKYYQKALVVAFTKNGIKFREQVRVDLTFEGVKIGVYYLDFLIEDTLILEIKKGDYFPSANMKQINEYLKAMGLQLGLLANFTSKGVKVKRIANVT